MSGSEFSRLARLENPCMGPAPHTNARCACCDVKMWIVADEEPICDECEEARQPLLAEIDRLKAELAKFHECDETSACHDDEGMIHTLRATPGVSLSEPLRVRKVYHKTGE